MKPTIVIIGAGIAGLSATYRLSHLLPAAHLILIERDGRLGGKIFTETFQQDQFGPFVIEAAPDSFLSRKTAAVALCQELGIASRLIGRDPTQAKTFVKRAGAFHPLPEGLTGLVPTNFEAMANSTILSAAGRTRLMAEVDIPAVAMTEDETVANFITRRFGQEAYEGMMEPLMSGIYGGDGRELSLLATFANLRDLEQKYGSVIRGLQAQQGKVATGEQLPPFVSLPGGMGELVQALTAQLAGVQMMTGVAVSEIQRPPSGVGCTITLTDGASMSADAIIFATPAFVTARLLMEIAPTVAQLHAEIPHGSSATISLVYPRSALPTPPTGYGYVIPRVEETDILACTWSSNKWQGRAPIDQLLLRVYVGRVGRRDVTELADDALLALALEEVRSSLGVEIAPTFWRIYRWPQSMPQYTLGHRQRVAQIERLLAEMPGVGLAGAAYRGVGIPDCIQSGEDAARAVAHYLTNTTADSGRNGFVVSKS